MLKKVLCAFAFILVFAAGAFAAEGGALARTAQKNAALNRAAESAGAGESSASGRGTDLRAISSLSTKKAPTTFTGFPAGTLPGDTGAAAGGASSPQEGRVVLRGETLNPVIGAGQAGITLDRVYAMADHAGYSLVRRGYTERSLDSPYVFSLIQGRRRVSTLYFDRSMKLVAVR
ncbi:MAG: hypothetical protein LBR61_01625 [Synergistaceae bacterium]|nr:hypothetical protein [Synergistaceae bacterium]